MGHFSTGMVIRLALMLAVLAGCSGPAQSQWRPVDPDDLLLIETRHGTTAIELNASFAPEHVTRMRAMARAGLLDGEYFYRVIDGFVAQTGVQSEDKMQGWPALKNENDRPISETGFVPLGNGDLFAPEVGHINGFAVARNGALGREWIPHCPGALAMARNNDPDSATTEFYIVLGPQRYLDRNLTVFGQVIDGMRYIQKLERGDRDVAGGVIQPPRKGDQILSVRIAADLPEADRPAYAVMDTTDPAFATAKRARRVREEPFFYRRPPEVLDICGFNVPVERR